MPLPPGLALNPRTGVISGVPTAPGTYSFTLRVRDSQGLVRDIPQSITVSAYVAPSLSGTLPLFANRTVAYTGALTLANGAAPFTWSIASGTLPTGITINASTGEIGGTPTDTSYTDRNITVRVVDVNGSAAQSAQTIRYADVLALSGSLASGIQGSAYSSSFTRTGGHSPFTYAITSGTLPPGLSLNTSTGVISGTPSTTTSNAITVRVTDASGAQQSRSGTISIASAYVPINLSGSITSNSQNVETLSAFSITPNYGGVSVSGGSGSISYSWARISGSTAISAGSPSSLETSFVGTVSPGSSVSATFRVTADDGISSDTLNVTITVTNVYVTMALSAGTLPRGTRTVAYSHSLSRTGGRSPFTFAVVSGTLPSGITLNSSTGALSGTPTDTGYTDRALTFRVTDSLGATANASATLTYRNFPVLTVSDLGFAMRTRTYERTIVWPPSLTASTFHTPGVLSVTSGTLPTGITLSGSTFSGTPTDTSYTDRTIGLRITDAAGNIANTTAVLSYRNNLSLAGSYPAGAVGVAYSSTAVTASGGYGSNVWSVASGSLPGGLSLNSSTGALTGTPTSSGTFSFTVRVTDAQGFTADSAQSVAIAAGLSASANASNFSGTTINSPPSFTPSTTGVNTTTPNGGVCVITASGGTAPYTYSWSRASGNATISANSPSSASTSFGGTCEVDVAAITAVMRCTVTDAASASVTVDVNVSLQYLSGF